MPRLIDADALRHRLLCQPPRNISVNYALELVSTMPSIDAVKVVRCKDCVYCKRFNDVWYAPKRDELLCTLYVETYHTTENDYCSRGERK